MNEQVKKQFQLTFFYKESFEEKYCTPNEAVKEIKEFVLGHTNAEEIQITNTITGKEICLPCPERGDSITVNAANS